MDGIPNREGANILLKQSLSDIQRFLQFRVHSHGGCQRVVFVIAMFCIIAGVCNVGVFGVPDRVFLDVFGQDGIAWRGCFALTRG